MTINRLDYWRTGKYKCRECDRYFDEPSCFFEHGEYWGAPYTEKIECCPDCNSVCYEEIEEEEENGEDALEAAD